MSNIVQLRMSDVDRLLTNAATMDFKEIVLIGYDTDNNFTVMTTGVESRTVFLGALELLKHDLLST